MFLKDRIPLGTSSLIERILSPGSILSRLESEKDCGSFKKDFWKLRQLLRSFADDMSYDGRRLEDVLREHRFQHPWDRDRGDVVDVLSELSDLALKAEDILEMVSTEITLQQQDLKQEAAASARRRRRSIACTRLFSKLRYLVSLNGLRSELNNILSPLQVLYYRCATGILYENLYSLEGRETAESPLYAKGMDSDLDKEVLTSKSYRGEVITLTIPFKMPVAENRPRDEDLKATITMLLSSALDMDHTKNDEISVLPIVGAPGVGKTTLAWFLQCNDQVSTHFRRSLWLDVSKGFNLDLITKLIEAIAIDLRWMPDQQEIEQENLTIAGNDAGRQTFLSIFGRDRNVHQHRYLIIVDGLKYEDRHKWLVFRESLKGTGSHVVVTTQHRAAVSEDSAMAYVLRGLPELCSWQFLLASKLQSQNNTLSKPLPRFIARAVHCSAGVPLLLGILRHHMDTDPRYLDSKEIVILRFSPSLADSMHRDLFVNLPDHLRNCFAYCSLFPPGYEMDKSTLIQLWMAQGFVPTKSDSDAEELGDEYFRDLLDRSLLSETQRGEFGNIRSCKMHKLMHDLSLLIAFGIVNKDWPSEDMNYIHVSHGNSFLWLDNTADDCHGVRTLLFLDQEDFVYSSSSPEEKLQQKLSKSRFLRVLDLHHVNVKRVPTSINEMKLLRYLDLSGNPNIITLPDSITRLVHLQTLKLSHCEKLKELPKDIVRLVNLRHLEIAGCLGLTHMPCGFGQLTALRTLSMFVAGEPSGTSLNVGELHELKPLNHLKGELELRHLERARSSSLASLELEKKEYLESVALEWETTDAGKGGDGSAGDDEKIFEGLLPHKKLKGLSIHGYRGVNFPKWFSSPCNLVKITVKDCHRCQSLPPLHQLPCLKYLILENMDSLEYMISDITGTTLAGFCENSEAEGSSNDAIFFPSLVHICMRKLPHLKGWLNVNEATSNPNQILAHSFPMLHQVTLDDCCHESNLTLPPAIRDLRICRFSKRQLENLLLQSPLPRLMSLCISHVKDLDYLPETLLFNLSSTQNLEIKYCTNLSSLPTFLTSLKSLSVVGCGGLTSLPMDIQHLKALETPKLKHCFSLDLQKSHNHVKSHNQIDFKWWPQFDLARSDHGGNLQGQEEPDSSYFGGLKSLSYLEITELPKLVSLPDGICKLPSLKQLCLSCCDNLKYLPEGMHRIPHLLKIKIRSPLLRERCCDIRSREWEKICHIWDGDLDWDEVQKNNES